MKKQIRIRGILVAVTTLLFLSCSKKDSTSNNNNNPPSGSNSNKVSISNMKFVSSSITINKNITVTWTNVDAMPHTVTADDNSFTSDELNQNDTYSHTFTTDGTFDYHCAIHTGMKGTVVVNY
jgi:amicyanin